MKKIFTFLSAALMSVSMFGKTVQQDITLNAEDWWGWDSSKENVDGNLAGSITAAYGAIATSNVGNADWSEWTKLVVEVSNIVPSGDVQWWYLKAELRNPGYEYPASITMTGELGKEGHNPADTNYVVIDLTTVPDGFDITHVDALVLQSEVAATFTVSRIFLEKEEEDIPASYFIIGTMTNWAVDSAYQMIPNNGAEVEEYMFNSLALTTTSQFKVVKVEGESQTWYPDGMGNNYGENGEIAQDGNYTIYFRPNGDGGEGWFYNVIYADLEPNTEAIENIVLTEKVQKVIVDGALYIVRDSKMFNAQGARVK